MRANSLNALIVLFSCLAVFPLPAQTPPPSPDISILPPDGSILITETTNSAFVTINNFDQFTNVTVVN